MLCDVIHCKNCGRDFVFRASTLRLPDTDPKWSETETDLLAVSCPVCKHVYDYSGQKLRNIQTPWGESNIQMKRPLIFSVRLRCDEPTCRFPLVVIAPREADTTWPEIEAEQANWTLHDLKCPNDHAIPAQQWE